MVGFARWTRCAAALLVLIASARIVATYRTLSNTTDEPAHIAAGVEWLENGTYTYEDQHPPLARIAAGAGILLAGARWGRARGMYEEGFNLLGYGHRYAHNLFYARAAMLPFFWVGCAAVFLWGRWCGGDAAGVLATLIFTAIPPVLGHAGLATTDMALAAFTSAACFAAVRVFERPGAGRALVFGLLAGLAVSSKFSALVFVPAGVVALYFFSPRVGLGRLAVPALVSLAAAACVLTAVYRFAPWPVFLNGLRSVWLHNAAGHPAWLLGRVSQRGFWYYYPVVLAVKTPLAALALGALGLRYRAARGPLAFAAAVVLTGSMGSINIGVRHVLPAFAGIAVAGGVAASRMPRIWAVGLLAWLVLSGARFHPEYIAYTNELAGDRPDRILADSDLDWGQDMGLLARRLEQLGVRRLTFKMGSPGYLAAGNDFPFIVQMPDGERPPKGWNAVSVTAWRLTGEPRWAETAVARERVGRSIYLYYFAD